MRIEVISIRTQLQAEDYKKAEEFLKKIKPILCTNDCTFEITAKNKEFDKQFSLKNDKKIDIIKSLCADDCVKIEPNNNPRFDDSEIYAFIKSVKLTVYGEREPHILYIKIYLREQPRLDQVIVISFHEEGRYD